MAYIPPAFIMPFTGFTNFTNSIPSFYWNVYSEEQRMKHICKELCKLAEYCDYLANSINADHNLIVELQNDFEDFKNGAYSDFYEKQIQDFINKNMERIISDSIKMVWFGITDDGYFVAYIPDTWDDITFNTYIDDYSSDKYGHLILSYDVDSPHTVTQP